MPFSKPFIDQMGREVKISFPPQRIVSLVPSQTELLFDLGLEDKIVGITKFCIHPAGETKQVVKVGGTKQLDVEKITSLKPDLIIANKEENERAQIEELAVHFPVWVSDIYDLDSALEMICAVGEITGMPEKANDIAVKVEEQFCELIGADSQTVAYLIWRKPYMAAGTGTFIDDMLRRCGFINAIADGRYPMVTSEQLADLKPDLVFLSSEPYPFKQKHIEELQFYLPATRILLVDGEMFSWYGSRMLLAVPYFKSLLASLKG
ncbi:ABC transporter substrate-binding protein [Mucilaginibacter ginkgonis]|uniref:ABC transporter substrate-binding protein n=1 Tax=Mucilaginibacter ginkgonis TaxID=2682091 RepID=A0A6I4I1T3_9SPHI|nr:helical backbone metal receptor [Mucilaginibacter ginkgonis]QQL51448.1 ABC transporter substrate-binding protein [Mucilaginibacter ginkgonis]